MQFHNIEVPSAFHLEILSRVTTDEQLQDLKELYDSGKQRRGSRNYIPSDEDVKAFHLYLKGEMNIGQVGKVMGIKAENSIVRRLFQIAVLELNTKQLVKKNKKKK